MKIGNMLRRIPVLREKFIRLAPLRQDIIAHVFGARTPVQVLDIGANIGQTIEFFHKHFPGSRLTSVEPTPELAQQLKRKWADDPTVSIHNIAFSDNDGTVDFYTSEFSPTNSCLEPDTEAYRNFSDDLAKILEHRQKITVPCMKLDTWQSLYNQETNFDIVKIDTQGFEHKVILGGQKMLPEHAKCLILEVHFLRFYRNSVLVFDVYRTLYEMGFFFFCRLSASRFNLYQEIENDVMVLNSKFFPNLQSQTEGRP